MLLEISVGLGFPYMSMAVLGTSLNLLPGARETARRLRALALLPEHPSSALTPTSVAYTRLYLHLQRISASGLHGHLHSCVHTHMQTHFYT